MLNQFDLLFHEKSFQVTKKTFGTLIPPSQVVPFPACKRPELSPSSLNTVQGQLSEVKTTYLCQSLLFLKFLKFFQYHISISSTISAYNPLSLLRSTSLEAKAVCEENYELEKWKRVYLNLFYKSDSLLRVTTCNIFLICWAFYNFIVFIKGTWKFSTL